MPPQDSLRRLYGALANTLAAFANDKPLVLVVDDLQWADELTIGALKTMADGPWLAQNRIAIIGTYRTEEQTPAIDALLATERATSIELDRLDAGPVNAMVADMLAMGEVPDDFSEAIQSHSEGNPFFVAEYLRLAVEQDLLRREDGRWLLPRRSGDRAASMPIPESLRDVVVRRFTGLSRDALEVLASAAVLGRGSDLHILSAMVSLEEEGLLEASAELERRHVIQEVDPGHLRFEHDKLREFAYARFDERFRKHLHAAAAATIKASADGLPAVAAELAHHYRNTDDVGAAARYSRLAGQVAIENDALAQAWDELDKAVELYTQLPASPSNLEALVDSTLELFVPGSHIHTVADDRVIASCKRGEEWARQVGRPDKLASVMVNASSCHFARGEFPKAMAAAEQCLDLGEALDNVTFSVKGAFVLTICKFQSGQIDWVFDELPKLLGRLEAEDATATRFDQMYPPYILMTGVLATAHSLFGRFEEAGRYATKSLAAAEDHGGKYGLGVAHLFVSWARAFEGALEEACEHGELCESIGRGAQLVSMEMMGGYAAGLAHTLSGQHESARQYLAASMQVAERIGYKSLRVEGLWGMALASTALGEHDDAMARCQAGLEASRSWGEHKLDCELHRISGEIVAQRGDVTEGLSLMQDALREAEAVGAAYYIARAQLSLGRLLATQRDPRGADLLQRACNYFRTMKPNPLLADAERALANS